jgi:tetratricopeptide (TPR) repeat protein
VTRSDWLNNRLECPHCGNRYLPPWRQGEFRCGVCATRLPTRSRFTAVRKTAWGLLLPVTLLGVALLMVGARSAQRSPSTAPALSASRPVLSPQWDPDYRERRARSYQASHQRQLRLHPEASAAHVAAAQDTYGSALIAAAQRIGPPPEFDGFGPNPGRREWQLKRESFVAEHLRSMVAPGVRQAEEALRLAKNADEEFDARRARADGWLLEGAYERAKAEYRWVETIQPGSAIDSYARCFNHLGERIPDSVQQVGDQFAPYADPFRSRSLTADQLQTAIAAHQEWQKRWPKDPALEMRLGSLSYRLAAECAVRRTDYPLTGPDDGARLDAFVYRHYPDLIRRGIAHYQRALDQAQRPWLRARAMEELAHGQLLAGQPEAAITTLRRAFALSSDLPAASYYARVAFQRLGRPSGPSGEAGSGEQASEDGGGAVGFDTTMTPPGMPPGGMSRRSRRINQILREGDRLLREVEAPERKRDAQAQRQDALNQIDELFPGSATGYDAKTSNVTDVDMDRVRMTMNQLAQPEDEGLSAPGPTGPAGLGGMAPGGPGGPGGPRFRP